jgi:lysozyme family protein
MSDHFAEAITRTLQHEGGYVNDPADPGGETNFGISKRAYPEVNIRNLTPRQARDIYRRDYWNAPGYYGIKDCELACKVFDLGVNLGPRRATRLLQMAANLLGAGLVVDGRIGVNTLGAVNGCRHQRALLAALKYLAARHYIDLDQPRFLAGWLNRLES